ncbi:plastocyanin [Mycobacterium sp. ACS1612]|uniref:cupredoxin domain-containing protein n=1 Tax=Mycobacterium sp. ACS1612 TaxID=1834117 RepID=UPI0007FF6789|nr:cupredoxin domain-containing protein [Mycobacterium sp. ACS1612]OBF33544.1 plastocyanin [Mycobacterium sp. ACS1612]
MKRFGFFLAAVCLIGALITACGGSTDSATASPTATTPAEASAATITIADMNYGQPVTVPPGAKITVKNNDSVEHSVTSDAADKFGMDVDGNEQGVLTAPTEPGEFAFHCKYHPSMHGTLIVK